MTKPQCCATVHMAGMWNSFQCSRAAKVERNGKHYCGQHDPEAVKARQAKANALYQAEREAEAERREKSAVRLLEGLGYRVTPPAAK